MKVLRMMQVSLITRQKSSLPKQSLRKVHIIRTYTKYIPILLHSFNQLALKQKQISIIVRIFV
nr:unnamed protein product [Callosobruchus chinensis]